MDRISDRVYVVTGASSGIGREIARSLVSRGAIVYAIARRQPEPVQSASGSFIPMSVDITDAAQVTAFTSAVLQQHGSVYGLINCAGAGIAGMLSHTDGDELAAQFDVNVFGAMRLIRAFVPQMELAREGVIINIGSIGGELPLPFQGTYSMTKAALRRATDTLRLELKEFHIEACCIEPGDLKTGFTAARRMTRSVSKDPHEQQLVSTAVGRMAHDEQTGKEPSCVSGLVLRLLRRRHLPAVATVGGWYVWVPLLQHLLPYALQEKIIRLMYM